MSLLPSWLVTLALHASLALSLVWLLERLRLLRHAGLAELAWRAALFGALLSSSSAVLLRPMLVEWWRAAARPAVVVASPSAAAVIPSVAVADHAAPRAERSSASASPALLPMPATRIAALPWPAWLSQMLVSLWLALALLAALRLCRQWRGLRRVQVQARQAGVAIGADLRDLLADVARHSGLAETPSARLMPGLASPMALPDQQLLLPDWVQGLSVSQRRALLAHECAHLRRSDPAWRLAHRLALLPLAWHPLAWHALARLEVLAEHACDAEACRQSGDGRALAECLALCVSHVDARAGIPELALAMTGRSGEVLRRVQILLKESPMSSIHLSPALRRGVLALSVGIALALPAVAVTSMAGEGIGQWLSHVGENRMSFRDRQDGAELNVSLSGSFTSNAAESDIIAMTPGAVLEIEHVHAGVRRELRLQQRDGDLQRRYRHDGQEQAFDADAKAWLAQLLPQIYRQTAIDVQARSQRILARGGMPALLAEIAQVTRDHARRRYLGVLLAQPSLDDQTFAQAMHLADAIDSDFELSQVLQAAVPAASASPIRLARLLHSSELIDSDFERRKVLADAAGSAALRTDAVAVFVRAWSGIDSDFEQRQVVQSLMQQRQADTSAVLAILQALADIGSDFELRTALVASLPQIKTEAMRMAYLQATDSLGSDFERRQALVAMLEQQTIDAAAAIAVLDSVREIGSDHEARETLQALAAVMPGDAELIERYRAVARGLSDFERGQAEKALDRFAQVN